MKYICTLLISVIIFTACSSTYTVAIPKGVIVNPEIIITAEDGSFKITKEFDSPFISKVHYHSYNKIGTKLIQAYSRAIDYGAKHVLIKVPNRAKLLHGVLALDNADSRGIGTGTKSYKIIIPQAYINSAKNGKISVVYEYYHLKDDSFSDLSDVKKYSWILWISDEDVFK